jgi:MFS family permease
MADLFKNRNFVLVWLAQVISGLGDVLYHVGVMVIIFEQTGSALQTAGALIATTLPQFLLGPFAGALVDRYPRQWLMVAMDLLRGFLVGLLLLFAPGQGVNIWGIYAVVAGLSAATSFYSPAYLALLPTLVNRQQLVPANSLIMTTNQATLAAGYVLGGILILRLGFTALISLNLVSFLIAGLLVALIHRGKARPARPAPTKPLPLLYSIREGLAYLRHHEVARPLVVMEILEFFPHGLWTSALMLVFVREALGGNADDWGYQNAAFYGGQLVGAAMAALAATRLAYRPGWLIIGNAFIFSLLTVGYALSPTRLIALILTFSFGPPSAIRDVAQNSLLQAVVAGEVMGRVYAIRNMFTNLTFMLAGAIFAWLADQVPIRWIYLLGGGLYLGTAVYALTNRAMRQSRIGGQAATGSI